MNHAKHYLILTIIMHMSLAQLTVMNEQMSEWETNMAQFDRHSNDLWRKRKEGACTRVR